jgi:Rrf2 family transcriptional regulator, cysteine metabolism repressor
MRVSSKSMYGLTALIDLALHCQNGPTSLSDIAKRQGLSVKYLEQIFPILKKSGIIKSILGANGGYILGKNAKNITIKEVLETIEDGISCLLEKEDSENKIKISIKKYILDEVDNLVFDFLNKLTLQDIINKYLYDNSMENNMFYI